jgi:hypothetical protein
MELIEKLNNLASKIRQQGAAIQTEEATKNAFIMPFIATHVYEGTITQRVREQFAELTKKATAQYLSDQVNERLKSAISGTKPITVPAADSPAEAGSEATKDEPEDRVTTTLEEVEGFHIVKAIVRSAVDVKRIAMRDTQSYCGVLLDDNNRKPICRLHFNRGQKYLGIFDQEKNETRNPIESVDDIYNFADQLRATVSYYL